MDWNSVKKIIDSRSTALTLIGKRIGKLKVIRISPNKKNRRIAVICSCDCGKQIVTEAYKLNRSSCSQLSCGCSQHNPGTPKTYHSWKSMKDRCFVKAHDAYPRYGGRGITITKRW